MAIQNLVARLISQHPHNGHIAPLLALYLHWQWGQVLLPYQCARAALRLQGEQCSCNAASQHRKLRNFNSFPCAPSPAGCSCLTAWPVSSCPISCQLLRLSPACQSFLLPSVLYSCNFHPPTVFHFFSLFLFGMFTKTPLQLFRCRCFSSPEWGGT